MAIGDVSNVAVGECTDIYAVDVGMYDLPKHAAVYVVDAPEPTIVETGTGANADRVLAALDDLGIDPEDVSNIVCTHVHLDHAGGAGLLAAACPNAAVYAHDRGTVHLQDPAFLVEGTKQTVGETGFDRFYTDPKPVAEDRLRPVSDGDVIDLGDRALRAHHAPGHATHQVVLHSPSDDAVFTADAAGIYLPEADELRAISPPPEFDYEQAMGDIETIQSLSPSALLFSHFGAVETGARLERAASALTEWTRAVTAAREHAEDDRSLAKQFVADVDAPERWSDIVARTDTSMNVYGVCDYLDRIGTDRPTALATQQD